MSTIIPFFRKRNWGIRKLSNFPRAVKLVRGGAQSPVWPSDSCEAPSTTTQRVISIKKVSGLGGGGGAFLHLFYPLLCCLDLLQRACNWTIKNFIKAPNRVEFLPGMGAKRGWMEGTTDTFLRLGWALTWLYGTSLAVQWLRVCAPTAGGTDSIPGQGTNILHAAWQKKIFF